MNISRKNSLAFDELQSVYKETSMIEEGGVPMNGAEERKNINKITLDDVFEYYIGEFGFYQKCIYFLACVPSICAAYFTLMPVFMLQVPDHR